MKNSDWFILATATLAKAGLETARLDSLVLLEDCLQQDRAQLLAHPEIELSQEQTTLLNKQLTRRVAHEPLAYIRGRSEFYGREFYVNAAVLEPRPESETIIELLKQLAPPQPHIADIGTGSGALAITAKLEIPKAVVAAVDIDEACLEVAKHNAVVHTAQITFYPGDLLAPFAVKEPLFMPTVLLANLPYVPDDYAINKAAEYEPKLALFGGPDGLNLYCRLFEQIVNLPQKPDLLLTESLPAQHQVLADLAQSAGYKLHVTDDFIQAFVPNAPQFVAI